MAMVVQAFQLPFTGNSLQYCVMKCAYVPVTCTQSHQDVFLYSFP